MWNGFLLNIDKSTKIHCFISYLICKYSQLLFISAKEDQMLEKDYK